MPSPAPLDLSRRERQIMDIVYRTGRATAAEVRSQLREAPSYSAVRASLRILVDKGHLRHEADGPRYVYRPTLPREKVRGKALRQVVQTFFGGSAAQAMAALLDDDTADVTEEELDRLAGLIERARKDGR
ncbi:MAG: BlaI/MecI/CopY family transcriptional regulator [Gemmatimonadales bacterium]